MYSKLCKTCGQTKPESEFHKHPTSTDLLRRECKACRNSRARVDYQTDAYKAKRKEYRSSDEYKSHKNEYMKQYRRRKQEETSDQ